MATTVEQLIVQMDADITRMESKLDRAVAKNKKAKADIASTWTGQGGLVAVEKAFDSLGERAGAAASEIPGLGAALGVLGPAGLAAAVGIGALTAAFEEARKTSEWAEGIERVSKALGLTTTQLQQFDVIFTATNIDIDKGREAIGALNQDFGKLESGLARSQLTKAFALLKISPDTIKSWGRDGGLTEQVNGFLDAAAKINPQELAAIARAAKVDPGVLASMIEQKDRFGEIIEMAKKYHIVIDEDVIAKSVEAGDKMKVASDIIDKNLKASFAGLYGVIADASTELAHFIDLLNNIPKTPGGVAGKAAGQIGIGALFGPLGVLVGTAVAGTSAAADAGNRYAQPPVTKAALDRLLHPAPEIGDVTTPSGHARAEHDRTDALTKTATDDLANASKDLAQAQAALTTDVYKHADLEQQAIDAEAQVQAAKLSADLKALLADNSIDGAQSDILQAKIEQAQIAVEATRVAKDQKADQDAYYAAQQEALTLQRQVNDDLSQAADIQAALSGTLAERRQIETANLLATQQLDRRALNAEIAKRVEGAGGLGTDQGQAEAGWGQQRLIAQSKLFTAQQAQRAHDLEGPVQTYMDSLSDLNSMMQDAGVAAAKSLADGLADAIVNAKSFGDVMSSVFKSLIQQIISDLLQKNLTEPLAAAFSAFIPHFASGTGFAPGGMALVGERGPELVQLPMGARVIPNASLHGVGLGGMGTGVMQVVNMDNRGAVIWEQAARDMMAYADRAATQAGVMAAQFSRAAVPSDLSRQAGRSLG